MSYQYGTENKANYNFKLKTIANSNKIKSQNYNKYMVTIPDIFKSITGICNKKNPKYQILKKCHITVSEHLDVEKIIKKLFEINILKSLLLGNKLMLFNQQYKSINLKFPDKSEKYVDSLKFEKVNEFDYDLYEKGLIDERPIDEVLLDGFNDHFNEE